MDHSQHAASHEGHGEHVEIAIGGMTCVHCAKKIQETIGALPGVKHVNVNHAEAKAHVHYDAGQVTVSQINEVIRRAGYLPGAANLKIGIKGMKCASCVKVIEDALSHTPGVISASVDPASASAKVVYQPEVADHQAIARAVVDAGYQVGEPPAANESALVRQETEQANEYAGLMRKFWLAAIISVPVMIFSYPDLIPGLRDWMPMGSIERRIVWGILGLMALPVMVWSGSQFYQGMWSGLKHRSANMHTLIAFGITAAFRRGCRVPAVVPQYGVSRGVLGRGNGGGCPGRAGIGARSKSQRPHFRGNQEADRPASQNGARAAGWQ